MNAEYNAELTRKKILGVAAAEIHEHGFQACSTGQIIRKAGVSKGAMYHHFSNKMEMGYAVFDEVFVPFVLSSWSDAFESKDPIEGIIQHIEGLLNHANCDMISKGCPLNNLALEMSAVDEGFRVRISSLIQDWRISFAEALQRGQDQGFVKQSLDVEQTALFLIASIQGGMGLAKNAQDIEMLEQTMRGVIAYLKVCKSE